MSTTIAPKNSTDESALTRVSIRKYSEEPISKEEITEILTLAAKAPSPFNVQPWRFLVVTSPELKNKLQAAAYNQPQVGSAPAVIVLVSDMVDALEHFDEAISPAMDAERAAGVKATVLGSYSEAAFRDAWGNGISYIALGYLLLILEARGLGSSPMLGFEPEKVKELLGLSATATIPAIISIGHKAEAGFPQHRSPVERVVKFVD